MAIKKDILALTIAGMSLFGTIATPIVTAMVASDDTKLSASCEQIYEKYADRIDKSPAERERILPGADGISILVDDPEAQYCKLTPAKFP